MSYRIFTGGNFKALALFTAIFCFAACKKNNDTTSEILQIKGSTNVANSDVILKNDTHKYTTVSNSEGKFEINNVARGTYSITVQKPSADSSYIANTYSLDIYSDTLLAPILLPSPLMLTVSQFTTQSSIAMNWSKFSLQDYFYEYKVYRKTDQGLDQNTGQLVYVSTDISDTSFTDTNLLENTTYYYRVYINNRFNNMAGSSIEFARTAPGNLISNGSFEILNSSNVPAPWQINALGSVVEDSTAPDGNHVLSMDITSYHYDLSFGSVFQTIDKTKLLPGVLYEISAYVKVINMEGNAGCDIGFTNGVGINYQTQIIHITSSTQKNEWVKVTNQFYADNFAEIISNVNILGMCTIPYANESYKILIDNIAIQKVN